MTTPARYPSAETVVSRTLAIIHGAYIDRPQMDGIIKAAVDLERERVAKEAGEVSCWRVAGGTWVDGEPLPCDYKDAEQNGWAIELAYTEQALPKKDSNETHVVESQNSAVKVPEDVSAAYEELIMAVGNKYPGETRHDTALRYIQQAEQQGCSACQSLTNPTETPQ